MSYVKKMIETLSQNFVASSVQDWHFQLETGRFRISKSASVSAIILIKIYCISGSCTSKSEYVMWFVLVSADI